MRSNSEVKGPLVSKRMRVQHEIINLTPQRSPYQPFGYVSLKSDCQQTTLLFNVYRDSDINLEIDHLLYDEQPGIKEVEEVCTEDEGVLDSEKTRCLADFHFALSECEQLGELLVTSVLLRNPEIYQRCAMPDLFDREGRLRSENMQDQGSSPMNERDAEMVVSHDDCYVSPLFQRLQL